VPFRQAHEIVGKIVREAERSGVSWATMPLDQLKKFSPLFEADLYAALTPEAALAARAVHGGTSPARVREAVAAARDRLTAIEASA
jgi:argininosuccinate lyase